MNQPPMIDRPMDESQRQVSAAAQIGLLSGYKQTSADLDPDPFCLKPEAVQEN
jgi:hypothetical protein